jgi:hypothetical protein
VIKKLVFQISDNGDVEGKLAPNNGLNSGNVTPAYGLSPNSSAVPLIRERVTTIQVSLYTLSLS